MHHMGMGAEALSLAKKLINKDHIAILKIYVMNDPHFISFYEVSQKLSEDKKSKKYVRRITRLLARKGLVNYGSGLLDDAGKVCGSSYAVTPLGKVVFNIVNEKEGNT